MVNLQKVENSMIALAYRQHELNCRLLGANWMALGKNWIRGLWIECATFMQLETLRANALVSIFHVGLSHNIALYRSVEKGAQAVVPGVSVFEMGKVERDAEWLIEQVARTALRHRAFLADEFFKAWRVVAPVSVDYFADFAEKFGASVQYRMSLVRSNDKENNGATAAIAGGADPAQGCDGFWSVATG